MISLILAASFSTCTQFKRIFLRLPLQLLPLQLGQMEHSERKHDESKEAQERQNKVCVCVCMETFVCNYTASYSVSHVQLFAPLKGVLTAVLVILVPQCLRRNIYNTCMCTTAQMFAQIDMFSKETHMTN